MEKLLLLLPLLLCSCNESGVVYERKGHAYIYVPRDFAHDPDCPKCKDQQCKSALQ